MNSTTPQISTLSSEGFPVVVTLETVILTRKEYEELLETKYNGKKCWKCEAYYAELCGKCHDHEILELLHKLTPMVKHDN